MAIPELRMEILESKKYFTQQFPTAFGSLKPKRKRQQVRQQTPILPPKKVMKRQQVLQVRQPQQVVPVDVAIPAAAVAEAQTKYHQGSWLQQ